MGNILNKKKKGVNFHELQIKFLIERCNMLELMKTLSFLVYKSDTTTMDHSTLLTTMIHCALGRYKRMTNSDTLELTRMIITKQGELGHLENALEYLDVLVEYASDTMDSFLLQQSMKLHNYFSYQLGQSEEPSFLDRLHFDVDGLSYYILCKVICLGHYIRRCGYRDNSPITEVLRTIYCIYESLPFPLFSYFPEMRNTLHHDKYVLCEMYSVFVPYDNAGKVSVIMSLYEHKPGCMLGSVMLRYGLNVDHVGKIRYNI